MRVFVTTRISYFKSTLLTKHWPILSLQRSVHYFVCIVNADECVYCVYYTGGATGVKLEDVQKCTGTSIVSPLGFRKNATVFIKDKLW